MTFFRTHSFWRSYLLTSAVAVLLLPVMTSAFIDYHGRTVNIEAARTVTASGTPAVAIIASNDTALPLNAFEVELAFDPRQLQLGKTAIMTSLCEERFLISNVVNNASGTALIQCGTITPFTGTSTTLAVFSLPNYATTSSLSFGARTHVLAHDGYGTNVTGSTTIALP